MCVLQIKPLFLSFLHNICRHPLHSVPVPIHLIILIISVMIICLFICTHIYFLPASGQAVVTAVVPSSPPRFLPSILIAHTVPQFHCSSIFHRVLLTHALALPAGQFVNKKKSPRRFTSMHSGVFQLTRTLVERYEQGTNTTALLLSSSYYLLGMKYND